MDGIKEFFETFPLENFWDTDNDAEEEFGDDYYAYNEDDWKFYKKLRTEKPNTDPKRLTLLSGSYGKYYNRNDKDESGGDGLHVLSPTKELIASGCESGDYNDCSYAILYKASELRILFAGDTHDTSWDHILKNHKADVTNVDLLIAPHHGRDSDRDWGFLTPSIQASPCSATQVRSIWLTALFHGVVYRSLRTIRQAISSATS